MTVASHLKTSSVFARVPTSVVRELDIAAELDGKSRSDAIRAALEAYVAVVARGRDGENTR
jgi:metal-responsive CopG/Arc/MetJ family transcriptional regulator